MATKWQSALQLHSNDPLATGWPGGSGTVSLTNRLELSHPHWVLGIGELHPLLLPVDRHELKAVKKAKTRRVLNFFITYCIEFYLSKIDLLAKFDFKHAGEINN